MKTFSTKQGCIKLCFTIQYCVVLKYTYHNILNKTIQYFNLEFYNLP